MHQIIEPGQHTVVTPEMWADRVAVEAGADFTSEFRAVLAGVFSEAITLADNVGRLDELENIKPLVREATVACSSAEARNAELEQALDDCYVHAVLMAKHHKNTLHLSSVDASHVSAIIRTARKVVPRLQAMDVTEAEQYDTPESKLLELYRKKRSVDGGGNKDNEEIRRRTWDAYEHFDADLAIEKLERQIKEAHEENER